MPQEPGECSRTLRTRCKKCGAYAELREPDIIRHIKNGCPNGCKEGFTEPEDVTPIKCEKCGKAFTTGLRLKNHRNTKHAY